MSILSDNLKKTRHHLGLPQDKAAESIGVKRSLLGAWEEGRSKPTLTIFPKLIAAYNIVDWKGLIENKHFDPAHQVATGQPLPPEIEKYNKLKKKLKALAMDC